MLLGIIVFKDALLSIAGCPTCSLFALPHSSLQEHLCPSPLTQDRLAVMGIIANASSQIFSTGTISPLTAGSPWHWVAINIAVISTELNIWFGLFFLEFWSVLLCFNAKQPTEVQAPLKWSVGMQGWIPPVLPQLKYSCMHFHQLTSMFRKCVSLLQRLGPNTFLLSKTGCELQEVGLLWWPFSSSMLVTKPWRRTTPTAGLPPTSTDDEGGGKAQTLGHRVMPATC